jgi:hypothetical protein
MSIVFCGDPHGEFRFLLDVCARNRPEAVVLLGDMMLDAPLRETLAPVFDAGIAVHYVGGNWDFHNEEWFDRLWGSHPTGDLHATFRTVGDLAVGGLGGVFLHNVWLPRSGGEEPRFNSREDMLRAVLPRERWRGWLPLQQRCAIVPEDIETLAQHRLDVLVCHEAPTTHRLGFAAIDDLAARTGAKLVSTGTTTAPTRHTCATARGCAASGVAEPWVLDPAVLRG